jgi:hypothetical protein
MNTVKRIKIYGRKIRFSLQRKKDFVFFFRRGNPLHLCEERYHALYRRWLSHTIPEDISRNMELNNTAIYAHNWSQF